MATEREARMADALKETQPILRDALECVIGAGDYLLADRIKARIERNEELVRETL